MHENPLTRGDSQAYIDALLSFLGSDDPLETQEETPARLRALTRCALP